MRRGHPLAPQFFSPLFSGDSEARPTLFSGSLLWSEGAIPVDSATSKEAMTHHALAKQKKDHC
jgi:hypothetical protein